MKTLKQCLADEQGLGHVAATKAIKEWLEQKLQNSEDNKWKKPVNLDPEENQQWIMKNYCDTLKELLEELEK